MHTHTHTHTHITASLHHCINVTWLSSQSYDSSYEPKHALMDTDLFCNGHPKRWYKTSGECNAWLHPLTSKRWQIPESHGRAQSPLMNKAWVCEGTFLICSRSEVSLTPRPSGLKKQWLLTATCAGVPCASLSWWRLSINTFSNTKLSVPPRYGTLLYSCSVHLAASGGINGHTVSAFLFFEGHKIRKRFICAWDEKWVAFHFCHSALRTRISISLLW